MIKLLYIPLIVGSLFITNGCDYLKSDKTKVGEVYNYEDYYIHKNFSVPSNSKNIVFELDKNIEYVKILSGLDADKFSVYGNKVHLNIEVDASNPQDANGDNIYEVKLYVVDKNKDDSIILLQIKVDDSSANDNNNTSGGSDDNSSSGGNDDHNNTGGGDDHNNTGGGDDHNNTGGGDDNNSSGGNDDHNNTGGGDDHNNTGGGMTTTLAVVMITQL